MLLVIGLLLAAGVPPAAAQRLPIPVCPQTNIESWTPEFSPDGIILTTFDATNLWVYEVDQNRRYPLPDTHPCVSNCRLSPDGRWLAYLDTPTLSFTRMRLDGTERTPLVGNAIDVEWWSADTLLVWTPGRRAYLLPENGGERQPLNVRSVVSVQPGGRWGLVVEQQEDDVRRALVNLDTYGLVGIAAQRVNLGMDTAYFNDSAWSPDGRWLAFAAPIAAESTDGLAGAELFGVRPGDTVPTRWTDLQTAYGAVRINGYTTRRLSWSPDGTQVAFWVTPLTGANPAETSAAAVIHVYNVTAGELRAYCGFSTVEHTPNPPRLNWSPDSTHLAFGGNIPDDEKGYLLLALDIRSGVFTELSSGIYPALGAADVIAWGWSP